MFRIDGQLHTAVLGTKIISANRSKAAAIGRDHRTQDNELGEILIERAQAVMHPGANGGVIPLEKLATSVKLQLRAMIVVGRPGRANKRDIVGALSQVRPPVADFDPALPTLAVADLQRQ